MKNKQITSFAINLDEKTKKQFENCIKEEFVISASLMPDAHAGYVAPIGSVIKTKNYVVPSWVGYDIGCGMIAVKLTAPNILEVVKENALEIHKLILKIIPMGKGIYNKEENLTQKTKEEFEKIFDKFKENIIDKNLIGIIEKYALINLGTLGSGNHFIELDFAENKKNQIWLVIHTGSRGIGHKLASKFMAKAAHSKKAIEDIYPLKFDSKDGKDYLISLDFCLDYALLNRLEIAYKIYQNLKSFLNLDIKFQLWTNKNHNHAIFEDNCFIHRKGATSSKKDEKGVIPANIRDGSFLVKGKGNKNFLESSSHGAGRIYSRIEAKKNIKLEDFKAQTKNIVSLKSEKFLDEAPQAYKNIFEVMELQKESVEIVLHLKPIINWKG